MTKMESYIDLDMESKPRCPDCLQPLTFIRTRSQEKKWYCYSCEKYTDHFLRPQTDRLTRARLGSLSGLQVIDSRGMVVGRVTRAIPSDTKDAASLIVIVDDKHLRTLPLISEVSNEVEIRFERIMVIGDVVLLSDAFSFASVSTNTGSRPISESPSPSFQERHCPKCDSAILSDATFCIGCGRRI